MRKESFTAGRIGSYECEPGRQQTIYWGTKAPGLGLRVTASGARSYIFESRLFGKTVRMTIGDPRAWDLGKARTEAGRLKTIVDAGQDPLHIQFDKCLHPVAAHRCRSGIADADKVLAVRGTVGAMG